MTAPPANTHQLQKKKNSRGKKQMKMGSPEAALPLEDGSDSGDEYHDALPGEGRGEGGSEYCLICGYWLCLVILAKFLVPLLTYC